MNNSTLNLHIERYVFVNVLFFVVWQHDIIVRRSNYLKWATCPYNLHIYTKCHEKNAIIDEKRLIRMSSLYTYLYLTSHNLSMLTERHVFFKQIDQNYTSRFAFVPWQVSISESTLHQSFHIAIHVIVTIFVITAWNAVRMTKTI